MTSRGAGRALALAAIGAGLLAARVAHAECSADLLCAPTDDPCVVAGTHEIDDFCTLGFGTRSVVVSGTLKAAVSGGRFAITSGPFTLDGGALRAHGSTGALGGEITVTAAGPFVMDPSGPTIEADGADGGGTVRVFATSIELHTGTISADGTATDATGGTVRLSTAGPLLIDASITAQGRGGGDSDGGLVDVMAATIDVRATINTSGSGSDGGPILLTATAGDVILEDDAFLNAHAGNSDETGGIGGNVDVDATGSIVVDGVVQTQGPGPDGSGGDVTLLADQAIDIQALVTTTGTGTESSAGDITIQAGTTIVIGARLDASASGSDAAGGDVDIDAAGDVTVAAPVAIETQGGASGSGDISVTSRTLLTIAGTLVTEASNGGLGGNIDVAGCTVAIDGTLDAGGLGGPEAGLNRLTATALTIGPAATLHANLAATPSDGFASSNGLSLRTGIPVIAPTADIAPALEVHVDPTITPCCGNGVLDAGEVCDDANLLYCDGCDPACRPEPPCADDGNACTMDCDPAAGCVYAPLDDTPCASDGSICTTDVCAAGLCVHPAADCDDGVACTVDACDPVVGCRSTPMDALCDDGDDCSADSCDATAGCVSIPRPDASSCDDHDVCTTEDACLGGHCVGTGVPLECDDGNRCTVDRCDPTFGCVSEEDAAACPCLTGATPLPAGSPCADGNSCSSPDTCDGAGHCVGGPVCDDGDPCTTDTCFFTCLHVDDRCPTTCAGKPNGTACSDGLVCTVGTCQSGVCASVPRDCGDEAACDGIDFCQEVLGCRLSYPPTGDPRCFTTVLDAFGCYKAKSAPGAPRFTPVDGLDLAGGFDSFVADVVKTRSLCLPASYADTAPLAPLHEDHLASYKIRAAGGPGYVRRTALPLVNQLGPVVVDAVARSGLLVPASMSLGAPPGEPAPPNPDAFACYKTRPTPGTSGFSPIADVAVADLFGTTHVALSKLTRLCVPVSVEGEDPSASTHATYLLCYKTKSLGGQRFLPRVVATNDRFPPQTLYLSKREEVCLPSARTDLP
jgi:cysteine-rich repeat protein